MDKNQVLLIVLDGWGYSEEREHNATYTANTSFYDSLIKDYPFTLLKAGEEAVGLPKGQVGNSEIGHTTIGAGRVMYTDIEKIFKQIENNEFEENNVFKKLFHHCLKNNSTIHCLGLLGDGGVHAHQDHLYAFLKAAKKAGIKKIAIHGFTDGRDTSPKAAKKNLEDLERFLSEIGIGHIATLSGRYYSMDRDNNWDRLEKFEKVFFVSEHEVKKHIAVKPSEIMEDLYNTGITDEFLEPTVFLDDNQKHFFLEKGDGVFFYNFRSDRAKMLSKKIDNQVKEKDLFFVSMTDYGVGNNTEIAFPKDKIENTLAEAISKADLSQAHIAETEKFPHATYFLNGGKQEPHKKEKHILLDSRKDVKTHDLAPEMRAKDIADKAIEEIESGTNFIFINFANPDMVGHTGNFEAIVKACEVVDQELKRVVLKATEKSARCFVTADHGNAELNFDVHSNNIHTAHTLSFVPAIFTDKEYVFNSNQGTLADIAPTILSLLKIQKPEEMTGKNLLNKC